MSDLILAVKREYFDQIKSGSKEYEYRLFNDYWRKRLINKSFERVIITLGYPRADDNQRRLVFKYTGYEIKKHQHPLFGDKPVTVFAIQLTPMSRGDIHPDYQPPLKPE